jgi:hypothetical protein
MIGIAFDRFVSKNNSHWNRNKNNSFVVMMIDNHQTNLRNLKDQTKKSR